MNEFDIQKVLFDRFLELNEFSEKNYLVKDENGKYTNVHFPNKEFKEPDDKRWFDITFLSNEPTELSLMSSTLRYTGVLYVDIYTPLNVGEEEAMNKYLWLRRLFLSSLYLGDVVINNIYIANKDVEPSQYKLQVAIEWQGDIDVEDKE